MQMRDKIIWGYSESSALAHQIQTFGYVAIGNPIVTLAQ